MIVMTLRVVLYPVFCGIIALVYAANANSIPSLEEQQTSRGDSRGDSRGGSGDIEAIF